MPSKYIKKGESPEGRERRLRAFKHNSYMGFVTMGFKHMGTIWAADTTTPRAKELSTQISKLLGELQEALKERVD